MLCLVAGTVALPLLAQAQASQSGACGSTHGQVVNSPPAIDTNLCSEGAISNYGFTRHCLYLEVPG